MVDCGGLENRWASRSRGFESLPLRQSVCNWQKFRISIHFNVLAGLLGVTYCLLKRAPIAGLFAPIGVLKVSAVLGAFQFQSLSSASMYHWSICSSTAGSRLSLICFIVSLMAMS